MREFVLISKGATEPFHLRSLPNSGRMDVVCNCVRSVFWLSFEIRKDSIFHVFLYGKPKPPVYIRFEGRRMKRISPDERNIAIIIRKALENLQEYEVESTPGVFVSRKDFKDFLEDYNGRNIYVLRENGKKFDTVKIEKDPVFIIGDHKGFMPEHEKILEGFPGISLGGKRYLSSHCIVIVNYLLDMMGF